MRRKNKWWHSLKLIVPAMLVLPPLGFLMLWKSRRRPIHKIVVSVLVLAVLAVSVVAAVRTDVYGRMFPPEIPPTSYDVRTDSRGRYINTNISELEREVFNQVVYELRHVSTRIPTAGEELTADMVFHENAVYELVAYEHDLEPEDVRDIYMKVSLLMMSKRK